METLLRLENDAEAFASETLVNFAREGQLSPEDLRLARNLVFGVLRTALTLDFLYGRFLARGRQVLSPELRTLLRVSAYQHYYLTKIPDYAIVNDAMEIGRHLVRLSQHELRFLNAVLRRLVADSDAVDTVLPQGNKAGAMSVRYSFPREVVSLLVKKYGGQKAAAIMTGSNTEPPLTIRVNSLRTTADKLAERLSEDGFDVQPGHIAPGALVVTPTPGIHKDLSLFQTNAFREGLFYVQDEGSQMVAHIAAPFARGKVLDLCAAPGGKTTHLAELKGGELALTATDSSPRRLELVRENLERLKTPGVDVVSLDALDDQLGSYDLVLVDAPCSGLGTVRRNPEIRYRISANDLVRHQQRQLEILRRAALLTRPGGAIIYSTCSVSDQENRDVVAQFLLEFEQWRKADNAGPNTTWPDHPEVDGFEAIALIRGDD